MKLQIIKSYKTIFTNPIILSKGDEVKLGKEETKEEWLGWIWCETKNKSGWIPKQIIQTEDYKNGVITEYYSAKELDVNEGDIVFLIREQNGWLWVKHSRTNEEGWIPKENIKEL